jgi:GNAT superfamily N-acetyltransferase
VVLFVLIMSPSIDIYPATVLDSPEQLRDVLMHTVIDSATKLPARDEIEDILASVPRIETDMAKKYTLVARASGDAAVLGMMSLQEPDEVISGFALGEKPIEITNAYVLMRGQGIGRKLVEQLEHKALSENRSEIVLVSGPRFKESGWPFWRHLYGEPVGVAKNYFEGAYDGMVWRKSLTDTK